jgi:hypothetical protein
MHVARMRVMVQALHAAMSPLKGDQGGVSVSLSKLDSSGQHTEVPWSELSTAESEPSEVILLHQNLDAFGMFSLNAGPLERAQGPQSWQSQSIPFDVPETGVFFCAM